MGKDPAKDFDAIAGDYAFFETHATEAEEDARTYAAQIAQFGPPGDSVRMLDFGCGTGRFTARFLAAVGWSPQRLQLTLVEPAEAARRQAREHLTRFTDAAISDSPQLPAGLDARFDVVLANHVFYYVPDLRDTLRRLIRARAPGGVFLTAIAGRSNALIQFWVVGFGLLGRDVPYHTSEDVESALRELGAGYEKQQAPYALKFADTEENRLHIIRFLLADHLAGMPLRPLLELFDQYSRAGRIEIQTESDHYTIRPATPGFFSGPPADVRGLSAP